MPSTDEKQLNRVLDQALALPLNQRAAFLDMACDNPAMRSKIEQLIASCETEVPEEFLQPPAESKQWIARVYYKLKRDLGRQGEG